MSAFLPRRACALVGTAAILGAACAFSSPALAASSTVVLSEVFGGGGNSGAPFQNDFIELGNRSSAPIDLTGWKVQYFSASGGSGGSTTLSGNVPAGATYLIKEAAGAGAGAALPDADATGTLAMSATNGRVDLYDPSGTLIDRVGYGTSTTFEGAPAKAPSNATSVARTATFADTDNNSADFTVSAPTPKPSSAAGGGGTDPEPAPTKASIAQIQGTGPASPLQGQLVSTTGVVTAAYPTGGFNGFYLQSPGTGGSSDSTPGASDGVFVFGATNVTVGQCYTVTATVTEYQSLTELTKPTVTPATDCAPVSPTPLATLPATDAEKEQYEGMLVAPQGTYTITNNYDLNTYGQLGLAVGDQPLYTATDIVSPGAEAAAYEAENLRKYITVDDGSSWDYMRNATAQASPLPYLSQDEPMRAGSQVSFAKPVILDYRFQWNFQPVGQVVGSTDADDPLLTENDRPATPPSVGGDLKIATFNVLNYFTDLGESEDAIKNCASYNDRFGTPVTTNNCEVRGAWTSSAFADQQTKIVKAINGLGADVVSLEEIETSSAISYRPGQSRDATLSHLVGELNAAGGRWAFVPSPVVTPGSEDVIRTAFIYNRDRVQTLDASQFLLDGAFANARYPLAQKFKARNAGSPFVVVANHFKSKGSGPDDGTGQGNSNPARIAQASAVTSWVNTEFADEAVFLVGDFNSYAKEDPVRTIEAAGFTNLAKAQDPFEASYQFSGRLGSLDHAFANAKAKAMVTGARVWDINADESVAMQYSRRNYNVTDFFAATPYAASDHDPLVVGVAVKGRGPK